MSDDKPTFTTGSLMRHVVVMSTTAAIGLIAIFAVDLINLFYISRLGDRAVAAAVGFAGVVGFFHVSTSIGLTIGITAVVPRLIGAGRTVDAKRVATSSLVLVAAICTLIGLGTAAFARPLLRALGATGDVEQLGARYLVILAPALPFLGIGMACAALLRSVGDARRAMVVTLAGAAVTALCDPVLIFVLNLKLEGAAIAAVLSRATLMGMGLHGVIRAHRLLGAFEPKSLGSDSRDLAKVAIPAVLSNLAAPVASAYVTRSIAVFGASAVAGQATIDRVTPVAFGLIYALSGAVGPILAQNLGAALFDRARRVLINSLIFMAAAVIGACVLLWLADSALVRVFSLDGEAARLLRAYCAWIAPSFLFVGALFVANAAFNSMGRPLWSTGFNWTRATLGTIPLVWWGTQYGPVGVLGGQALGSVAFGATAVWMAFRLLRDLRLDNGDVVAPIHGAAALPSLPVAPKTELVPGAPL